MADPRIIRAWMATAEGGLDGVLVRSDGSTTPWTTSPVIGIRHRLAITANGSHYYLSTPRTPGAARDLRERVSRLGQLGAGVRSWVL